MRGIRKSRHSGGVPSSYRIAGVYILIGILWIVLSDYLFSLLFPSLSAYREVQTLKGWLFVLGSGLLIFLLIRTRLRSLRQTTDCLARTERILRVLTECNQTIIRAESEANLLERIGNILLEHGGFRFTAIMFRDPGPSGGVSLAMFQGNVDDRIRRHLESIAHHLNDGTHDTCPVVVTFASGKRQVVDDAASTDACRRLVGEDKLGSLAILPLKSEADTFGVLMVCSDWKYAFNNEELLFLSELAEDISFGVMAYRRNSERLAFQETMRLSEKRYRTLFETMAQGVIYQSATGKLLPANPAAGKILGLPLEKLQGQTALPPGFRTIYEDGSDFPWDDYPPIVALRTGKTILNIVIGVVNTRTDTGLWLLVSSTPLFRNGDNRPCEVYTSFDDITIQKTMEQP